MRFQFIDTDKYKSKKVVLHLSNVIKRKKNIKINKFKTHIFYESYFEFFSFVFCYFFQYQSRNNDRVANI